jgi:hypothetical protein
VPTPDEPYRGALAAAHARIRELEASPRAPSATLLASLRRERLLAVASATPGITRANVIISAVVAIVLALFGVSFLLGGSVGGAIVAAGAAAIVWFSVGAKLRAREAAREKRVRAIDAEIARLETEIAEHEAGEAQVRT